MHIKISENYIRTTQFTTSFNIYQIDYLAWLYVFSFLLSIIFFIVFIKLVRYSFSFAWLHFLVDYT